MQVQTRAMFISAKPENFVDKKGKKVSFQRVQFMAENDDDVMSLTAPADVDFTALKKLDEAYFTLNVFKNYQGYLQAKVVAVDL